MGFGIRINQFFLAIYKYKIMLWGLYITYLNMSNYTDKRTGIVYTNIGSRSDYSSSASSRSDYSSSASSRSDYSRSASSRSASSRSASSRSDYSSSASSRSASSRSASSRSASSRSAYNNADHLDAFIPPAFLKTYFGKD
jgi:hypothetical protein